jgi:RNA polymerase sigma-70 factor
MQSAAACPFCRHPGPFNSNICPRCQSSLSLDSSTALNHALTYGQPLGEAPSPLRLGRSEIGSCDERGTESSVSSLPDAIRPMVRANYEQARKFYPQVSLSLQSFIQKIVEILDKHLPALVSKGTQITTDDTAAQFLNGLRWQELFLATACAEGDEAAWQIFQSQYHSVIQKTARCCAENISEARELSDSLMSDLFLPARSESRKKGSKIGQYDGVGSLEGWIKVVVSRMAIDQIRSRQKQVSWGDLEIEPVDNHSSANTAGLVEELDNQRAARIFAASLKYAVDQLTSQERLVLNLYYLQDVNLKEIGRLLKVHESTASRAVDRIKKQVRQSVEKHLREHFRLKQGEIHPLIEMAHSQTEVDFRRILAK